MALRLEDKQAIVAEVNVAATAALSAVVLAFQIKTKWVKLQLLNLKRSLKLKKLI